MTEEEKEIQALHEQIEAVLDAAEANDLDTVYDNRAAIVSMYAQAMVEFHFDEDKLDWLNEILGAVEDDDIAACRRLFRRESDTDTLFLASQFAAVMAGFFHHDECMSVVQALGLQALLRGMQSAPQP